MSTGHVHLQSFVLERTYNCAGYTFSVSNELRKDCNNVKFTPSFRTSMLSGHDQPWESFEEGYMYHLYHLYHMYHLYHLYHMYHVSPETVAFQEGNINVNA